MAIQSRLALALLAEVALIALLPAFGNLSVHGNPARFVAIYLAAGAAFGAAVFVLKKMPPTRGVSWIFWTASIALRLAVFAMPPGDDLWRYIWEGRIQLHGFNPYLLSPQAAELQPLRDAIWMAINHPDWATVYPPGAQLLFAALARISEFPWFWKAVFTIAELGCVAVLLRLNNGNHARTAWFAWNPLVVCSFAGAGHYDSLMLLPLVAAMLWLDRRQRRDVDAGRSPHGGWLAAALSAVFLGMAIALKIIPVFLLPVWLIAMRRRAGWLSLSVAIPWLLSLFYGGLEVVKKPLTDFAQVTRFNDLLWWLVEASVWPNPQHQNQRYQLVLCLVVLVIAVVFRDQWQRALLWSLGAMLILSPVLHPWYLTWILPIACWQRAWPWLVLSISVAASLLVWEAGPFWSAWEMTWPLRFAVSLPPLVALIIWKNTRAVSIHEPADA